jgi:hypothetical protein
VTTTVPTTRKRTGGAARNAPVVAARRRPGSFDREPTTVSLPTALLTRVRERAVGRNVSWALTDILAEYFAWHGSDAYRAWRQTQEAGE